jgi:uncharacterized protein YcnI
MTLRTLTRVTTLAALTAAALLAAATSAFAHVTVHSDDAVAGATDATITFRVPNEEVNAQTTAIQVIFPTDHPLIGVLVKQHPGWSADVQTTKLPSPVQTDDGPVSAAVSQITWTGGSISGDNYDDFDITAGQVPKDVTDLTFKAIQTYSNHDVVRWIDIPAPGGPEPDHPAPILHLTAANQDNNAGAGPSVSASAHSTTQSESTTRTLSIVALIVAVLAALLAIGGLLRKQRTT